MYTLLYRVWYIHSGVQGVVYTLWCTGCGIYTLVYRVWYIHSSVQGVVYTL